MTSKARLASEAALVVAAVLLVVGAACGALAWVERHVAPRCCSDVSTWRWQGARAAAVALALVLVVVVRPRLGRAVAAWARPARELAVTSVTIAAALAAALGAGELILRAVQWDDRAASEHDDLPAAHADARLGWSFWPSQTRRVGSVDYAIDERGNRAARAGAAIDPTAPSP